MRVKLPLFSELLIAIQVVAAGITLGFGLNLELTWLIVIGITLAIGAITTGLVHIFSKAYRKETTVGNDKQTI